MININCGSKSDWGGGQGLGAHLHLPSLTPQFEKWPLGDSFRNRGGTRGVSGQGVDGTGDNHAHGIFAPIFLHALPPSSPWTYTGKWCQKVILPPTRWWYVKISLYSSRRLPNYPQHTVRPLLSQLCAMIWRGTGLGSTIAEPSYITSLATILVLFALPNSDFLKHPFPTPTNKSKSV